MDGLVDDPGRRLARKVASTLAIPPPPLTPRRVHGRVSWPGKATSVIGIRRAGKTTFLHQMRRERLEAGVPLERLPMVDFEDEQLIGLGAADLGRMLEEYYRLVPDARGQVVTWCLDEIDLVPGWERFVRRVLDQELVEVFVSGSSARLLSREVATAMRGRGWEVVIHPFSFEEALRHRGAQVPARPDRVTPLERSRLERSLTDYLEEGGFPEAQGLDAPTRHRLLLDYVDVAILRDVVERHGVSNVTALRWLVRHLLGNAAGTFSVERFHAAMRSQGLGVSRDTVHEHLAHLVDAFLVRVLWMEADSERRRMVNPRKVYPIDPGLIPVFDRSGRSNVGHALETVVLLELERRRREVTWVRTAGGREVDFLAREPGGPSELIQVCADARHPETARRELVALEEARAEHPAATARLLVLTADALPSHVPNGVIAQPAWEWLVDPS
jgi:uncharacterized protein